MVNDDEQFRNEAGGFGGPVADDSRRGDHERGARSCRAGQLGEHRRGLSEAHVKGQASAKFGSVEEPDPSERFGLVGTQLADKSVGSGNRRRRHRAGPTDDVGGPAVAVDVDAATQPGPVETDAVAQNLGSGELIGLFAFVERSRGLSEVDPVNLDPTPTRGLHERAGLPRQPSDLGCGELDVVEEHRPGDVAELVRSHHRAGLCLGEQSQRRSRLASRQRRYPHVEPDGGEGGAGNGHQLPRLVLTQRDLPATLRTRTVEGGQEPSESRPLGGHRSAAALGPQRCVDRAGSTPARWRVDRDEPDPTGTRRVELHDEPRTRRRCDGTRPMVECSRHGSGERGGGTER